MGDMTSPSNSGSSGEITRASSESAIEASSFSSGITSWISGYIGEVGGMVNASFIYELAGLLAAEMWA